MKTVGIAEFKARLSEFIGLVQRGEGVVVTDRGRPVVTVNRVSDESNEIDELVRAGIAIPPRGKLPDDFFTRERPPKIEGPGLVDAVIQERREAR